MRKVCLLGAPLGTPNMGVSALCISFVKIMKHIEREMDISLLVGAKKFEYKQIDLGESLYNLKVVNHRMSLKSRLKEHLLWILLLSMLYRIIPIQSFRTRIIKSNAWLKEVDESIFVGSIHGGDSFSDIYGLNRYFSAIIPDLAVILLNKPFVLLPQTYGPYNHSVVKTISRFIVKRACAVLCRDKNGPDTVKKLIGNIGLTEKILFCPDMAFFLQGKSVSISNIIPNFQKENKKILIGINVNGLIYNGGYSRKNMFGLNLDYGKLINRIIQRCLMDRDVYVILIPHNNAPSGNVESDMEACEEVARNIPEKLNNRVYIIEHKHSPSEIKGVISKCNFFIGSRMHSCIAALSYGIPTIGIAYSKKFIGVFESIGADALVVDARIVSIEEAINIIWKHFDNRNAWGDSLKSRVLGLHKTIIDIFEDIVKMNSDYQ